MSDPRNPTPRTLPGWLIGLVSAGVAFHLFALAVHVVAAPSGPWPTPFGRSTAMPPKFSQAADDLVVPFYLKPLRQTHNYHFVTNQPEVTSVSFEVRLKDRTGRVTKLKFPDETQNPWVRFRQELAEDDPVQLPRGELIPAPGQKMQKVKYWNSAPGETEMRLIEKDINLVPKDRPISRPREWSQLLARSYIRHLMRQYPDAASAELIRIIRDPVMPGLMYMDEPPAGTFNELVFNFGEVK